MSSSLESNSNWVYRIFDRRAISVKAKNDEVRKIAAVDLLTGLPFGIEVMKEIHIENFMIGKTYDVRIKVYTARDVHEITPEYVAFFEELDVDQTMEDFIKVYWLYPKLIKFELVEVEPIDS